MSPVNPLHPIRWRMLPSLSDLFGATRAPAGYRPRATLEQLRRNLGSLEFEWLDDARGRFRVPTLNLSFDVSERTQSELLMHLVLTDFKLEVPARGAQACRFKIRHTGALSRTGISCKWHEGGGAWADALNVALLSDAALKQALMPLDFRVLELVRTTGMWTVRLEHMAASEVVSRMPHFRRYIRLDHTQRDHLLDTFVALQRILRAH